jgi:hypothetical protein
MALMAAAFPIPPGKTEDWKRFVAELNGSRKGEFTKARQADGVRERTFLQPTPMGDLVIVTLEGDDPAAAFARFSASSDPFAVWFREQVKDVHGLDLAAIASGPMPMLVADSEG